MSLGKTTVYARKAKHTAHLPAVEVRIAQPVTMQRPVLVLNASYEPINICGARRALVLVLKGVARTEEEQGAILHAARARVPMPSVIRLLEYRRIPHQTRALSRKNILLARPQLLPVLRRGAERRRAYAGPCTSALPWRTFHLGKSGGLLPQLQPAQREPSAHRAHGHEATARTAAVFHCTPAATSCA